MTTYTSLPENMKRTLKALGYTLGLNQLGELYITHNMSPQYPQIQRNSNRITASTGIQKLSLSIRKENKNEPPRLVLADLSVTDLENNTTIRVNNGVSQTQLQTQIVFSKNYEFSLQINLQKSGTIEITSSDQDTFSYLEGETTNKSASEIIKYLNDVDIRLLPLIEYFAGLTQELSTIFNQLQIKANSQSTGASRSRGVA